MRDADRLDGWKTIGAHFGRDRTTAIRWANDRGLPVHFIPGGKTRTVYALRSELDAWARHDGEIAGEPPADDADVAVDPVRPARPRSWIALVAGAGLLAAAIALAVVAREDRLPSAPPPVPLRAATDAALPRDPIAARLLVEARDDWAQRTGPSLTRAIAELGEVTRRAPDFAPAFADLADAYVLARESGSLPDALAFARARDAADRARTLDPGLASAYRALGFVAYWWNGDRAATGAAFAAALRLAPNDAQTHFWYANVLTDNGEDKAASREFDAARLGDPGSGQIGADYAWALWSIGRDGEALARLRAIIADDPDIAEAHDCLATILLARGDVAGYVAEQRILGRLRARRAGAAELAQALATGGRSAVLRLRLRQELAEQAVSPFPDHADAAFFASLAGDRAALLAVLATADRVDERWGSAGTVRRIIARWRGDPQVAAALAKRAPPPIEPAAHA